MNPEPTAGVRDEALRAMLVDAADAAVNRRPRTTMTRRALVATVAAFTLAGALTGGAVSAVALANDQSATAVVDVDTTARLATLGDAKPVGTPFMYTGTGDAVLELGTPPKGATDFIYRLTCEAPGSFVTILDSDETTRSTTTCDAAAASSSFGGAGSQLVVADHGPHTFSIQSSARYSIWGSWAAEPTPPTPSAAQRAALVDGVVSREEYVTAYQRFSACMSEAGFPLAFVDLDKTVIEYSTTQESETDGASPRCYVREFEQVDLAWQTANEDTSYTAQFLGDCLLARGISPGATLAEKIAQLEDAGMSPIDCG